MSAASEREKALAELSKDRVADCVVLDGKWYSDRESTKATAFDLAYEIVRLRQQLTRMACPVCGTVNPPEVHTCTPRATCTVEERAHLDTHPIDAAETRYLMLYRALTPEHQKQVRDYADMLATQHTVRRVALVEETRG